MRRLLIIGVGVGDPGYVTAQAAAALREVDVFFVLDKAGPAHDLTRAREAILRRFVPEPGYRSVVIPDPVRDRAADDYEDAVRRWRQERVERLEERIGAELGPGGVGAILVWGDPSLYDGTIRIVETLVARGRLELDYEVLPGVSSIHALAARHRVTLNRVAGSVLVTTGRRLARGWPQDSDDVVVMLDADLACRAYADEDIDIYWGAYLGEPEEILVAGALRDVIGDIERERAAARERRGWIMDTYLLRRHRDEP